MTEWLVPAQVPAAAVAFLGSLCEGGTPQHVTLGLGALRDLATRAFPDEDVGAAFGRLLDHVHRNAVDGT